MAVDFESDKPVFYWTFDTQAHLKANAGRVEFLGQVWKTNLIKSYRYDNEHVAFESPQDWLDAGETVYTVRLLPDQRGMYVYVDKIQRFEAVRAESANHVVLSGRWNQADEGAGVFLAVFPK